MLISYSSPCLQRPNLIDCALNHKRLLEHSMFYMVYIQNIQWKNICQRAFAMRATADKSLHPTRSFFAVRRRADRTMTLSQIVHLRALSHEYTLRRTLNRTLFLTTSAA